jgi:flagellar hook-associated protein 1 FlgK
MSLTRSLDVARSHLSATAEYMQTVSRNVARAGDPYASRKTTQYVTNFAGGVKLSTAVRTDSEILRFKALTSTSEAARDKSVADALTQLNDVVGDPELETSPAAMIQKLERALQLYSEGAQDLGRADAAMRAAQDVAAGLRSASQQTQLTRQRADTDISNAVQTINTLLSDLETVNGLIVRGTQAGRDVTDEMDKRDQIVSSLSEHLGIRTEMRADGDMAVRTDSGVTLFDRSARKLTFTATGGLDASTQGSAIFVDGVPVSGPNSIMPITSGSLAGLLQVRDVTAPKFQAQLDEIARGLVEAFAESDQSGGGGPALTGLFSYNGGPGVPASGARLVGIAATISVNPTVVTNPYLIRDGGINGANYVYNAGSPPPAGYNGRILALTSAIAANRPFDASAGLDTTANITGFASGADGWLSAERQAADSDYEFTSVLYERATDSLNKVAGINVQEEYLVMLELERGYQASTKLIATIDSMFESLLAVAR